MVVKNGTIVTMESAAPEVQALAVRGDRIVAAGTTAEIEKYVGPATEVIDLGGLTAIPGLIEGHGHFMGLGQSRMVIDLMDVTSWDDIVRLVGEAAAKAQPGEWIRGRGWHQEKWSAVPQPNVEGFPPRRAQQGVAEQPGDPRTCEWSRHLRQREGVELAGITAATKGPAGGDILKDRAGRPIGVLGNGVGPAEDALAARSQSARPRNGRRMPVRSSGRRAGVAREGRHLFQDAGESFATVDVIDRPPSRARSASGCG
jgi:hypothetical protein